MHVCIYLQENVFIFRTKRYYLIRNVIVFEVVKMVEGLKKLIIILVKPMEKQTVVCHGCVQHKKVAK